MKNYILFIFKGKLLLSVKGNNIERFIKRLNNNNIEITDITYISKNEIYIKIYKSDYKKILKLKTIYEIEILNYYGSERIKNNIFNNKFIIILVLISIIALYIVTSMIFSVDVITNDKKMEEIIIQELKDFGIEKYHFKKKYEDLQLIKNKILNKYKDSLEWIEIETVGTKYIIRYEPRIINNDEEVNQYRNIIATKDAIITNLYISNGQIVKNINSFVKKGDVIVSGYITLNNNIKSTVSSKGIVYGETWYKVTITYPFKYYESHETGNKKNVFVIKFLDKEIELFNFNKYKSKKVINDLIFKNNILPISFVYQHQSEIEIIDENNSEEELIRKAIEYSKDKLSLKLKDDEYIKSYKILDKSENNDSITLCLFFSVIENITGYQNIEKYEEILE